MNKTIKSAGLAAMLMLSVLPAMAQKKAINSADYEILSGLSGQGGDKVDHVVVAKLEIDKASIHPTTANDPYMWIVRAITYAELFRVPRNDARLEGMSNLGQSGFVAGYSMQQFYKLQSVAKRGDVDRAPEYVGNVFSAIFNESGSLWARKSYDSLVEYYNIIDYLYNKLDTAMVNDLERQGITQKSIYSSISLAAMNSKNAELKQSVLEGLLDKGYGDAGVYYALSNMYLEKGDTLGAEGILRKAIERNPNEQAYFQLLVSYFVKQDKLNRLFVDVNKQIGATGGQSNLYYTRGYLYDQQKKPDSAIADYRKAIELDPYNYDANFNLGVALMKYKSQDLYSKKMKASTKADRDKVDLELKELFSEAKKYLLVANDNAEYSVEDKINLYKSLKSVNLELGDKESAAYYEDLAKVLEEEGK